MKSPPPPHLRWRTLGEFTISLVTRVWERFYASPLPPLAHVTKPGDAARVLPCAVCRLLAPEVRALAPMLGRGSSYHAHERAHRRLHRHPACRDVQPRVGAVTVHTEILKGALLDEQAARPQRIHHGGHSALKVRNVLEHVKGQDRANLAVMGRARPQRGQRVELPAASPTAGRAVLSEASLEQAEAGVEVWDLGIDGEVQPVVASPRREFEDGRLGLQVTVLAPPAQYGLDAMPSESKQVVD
eukprot:scaffold101672_cov90-Phaeocystis_antarctica.AAC.1